MAKSHGSTARGIVLALLLAGCATQFPVAPTSVPAGPTPTDILERRVEASGGDPFAAHRDIAAAFAVAWIDPATFLLFRVDFTLEGAGHDDSSSFSGASTRRSSTPQPAAQSAGRLGQVGSGNAPVRRPQSAAVDPTPVGGASCAETSW